MTADHILRLFDDQLEIREKKRRSSQLLFRKSVENGSELQFTPAEYALVAESLHAAVNQVWQSFYLQLHDNLVKELSFVEAEAEPHHFLDNCLRSFKNDPAKEGGNSLRGMIAPASRLMITATYEPGYECRVAAYRVKM